MIINVTNNTNAVLTINDLGITFTPNETKDLCTLKQLYEISSSSDLITLISTNKVYISDGTHVLTTTEAIQYVVVQKQVQPLDIAKKPWVHQSSRPFGTVTYFTGASDKIELGSVQRGQGDLFEYVHTTDSTSMIGYIYFDICTLNNKVYLHEGYITWSGGKRDTASMEIVPRTCNVELGSNTYFNLYNGYLVVPAAGDGYYNCPDIDLLAGTASLDCGLIHMPLDELGNRGTAFWNAEIDLDNMMFKNISPAPFGNGEYNLFAAEIVMARFINRIPLLNDGFLQLQTSDVEEIGHGMRVRAVLETRGENHNWEFAAWLTLNVENTV